MALLALSVVVFAPGSYFRWVLPKEFVALAAAVLASIALPRGRLGRAFWAIAGAGFVVLILAALVGAEPMTQVLGGWPRYEGLVAVPVYVAAAWTAARMLGPDDDGIRAAAWHRWLAVSSIALGVVSVFESWGAGPISTDLERPGALLGNASDQGLVGTAFLLMLVIPAFRAATADGGSIRNALLLGTGVVAAAVTVVLSESRGALLGLGVGAGVGVGIVLVRLIRQRGVAAARPVLIGAGAGVAALAAVVLVAPGVRDRLFALTDASDRTLADRQLIWQQAIDVVARSPWTGAGPSGFIHEAARGLDTEWYRVNEPGAVLDSPHNLALQVLVAGGVPLLVVALAGLGLVVARFARAWGGFVVSPSPDRRGDLVLGSGVALLAILTGLLTHFTTAGTGILAGALVGIIVARGTRAMPLWVSPMARSLVVAARGVGLSMWALWMALNVAADYRVAAAIDASSAAASDRGFVEAVALRPWDPALASIASQVLTARADSGDPDAAGFALVWAERAMALAPTDIAPRMAHAVALRAGGDAEAAVRELDSLRREYPADPDVALQLGLAQAALGDEASAVESLRSVLLVWPDEPTATKVLEELVP